VSGKTKYPNSGDDSSERQQDWYNLAICEALLGHKDDSDFAMSQTNPETRYGPSLLAKKVEAFRRAEKASGGLPGALRAIGEVFRVLDYKARTAPPGSPLRDMMISAGCVVDRYDNLLPQGAGQPESVCRIHWEDGNAVLSWQRDTGGAWSYRILAYGLSHQEIRKKGPYGWEGQEEVERFYLPHAPVLQPYPMLQGAVLSSISYRSGRPYIKVFGRRESGTTEWEAGWRNGEWVSVLPHGETDTDYTGELNRIETLIFDAHDYQGALAGFKSFEQTVRDSSLFYGTKDDLLKEAYYHEGLCYLKLGQTRRAESVFSGLWNISPADPWCRLAKSRLTP
jgi:hypothetical protein